MHVKYCFGLDGSAPFMRPAADALEVLQPFFESDEWEYAPEYFTSAPALYLNRSPQAMSGLEVFGVIFGFIGTCFAKKLFDEVYERTLKRPIGAYLDSFFQKATVPEGKAVEYRDVIYFEDLDLAVVIRVIATKETTAQVQTQVMHGHRVAHAYIETHGRSAPIHCHKIIDGQVSVDPEFFQNLEEIKRQDRAHLKVTWRK
jgi:hypothetical protein